MDYTYLIQGGGGIDQSVIADPYSVSKAYSKGDLAMNNGYLYSALSDMEAGEWDAAKWLKTNLTANIPITTADLVNDVAQGGAGFLTDYAGTWEEVTNKLITSSAPSGTQKFYLNRTLKLIYFRGWFAYSSTQISKSRVTVATFNKTATSSLLFASCTILCKGTEFFVGEGRISLVDGENQITVECTQPWYNASNFNAIIPLDKYETFISLFDL